MKYDFTTIMNRHGKDAIAVDAVGSGMGGAPGAPKDGFDVIPMWVADMNFPTVPTVQEAVIERVKIIFMQACYYSSTNCSTFITKYAIVIVPILHISYYLIINFKYQLIIIDFYS